MVVKMTHSGGQRLIHSVASQLRAAQEYWGMTDIEISWRADVPYDIVRGALAGSQDTDVRSLAYIAFALGRCWEIEVRNKTGNVVYRRRTDR